MSGEAKFKIIENYITDLIRTEELKAGDQIMTEEELCKQFDVSRMTASKAITNLVSLGYIKRIAGKGSFVTAPHIIKNFSVNGGFSEDIRSRGLEPSAKLVNYEVIPASECPRVSELLNLKDDELLHHFVRVRSASGTPIAIGEAYVTVSMVPSIDINALSGSFYDYLDSLMIYRNHFKTWMSAVIPNENEKELLNCNKSDFALLKVSHITYGGHTDEEFIPFEYAVNRYNSELYTYYIENSEKQSVR
ncbi:MAG: GntR family transcriptional regulator [Atopobium sp.]|nr:GntR family transcriptional regulator [Atopobium sp.]